MLRRSSVPRPTLREAIAINQFCDSNFVTPRGPPWEFTPNFTSAWSMTIQSFFIQWSMGMGVEAGCHIVPDPVREVILPLLPISIPSMFMLVMCDGCAPPAGVLMSMLPMSCLCGAGAGCGWPLAGAGAACVGIGMSIFSGAGAVAGALVSAGVLACL